MKVGTKIIDKILMNCMQQYIRMKIHHNQVVFILGIWDWVNTRKINAGTNASTQDGTEGLNLPSTMKQPQTTKKETT